VLQDPAYLQTERSPSLHCSPSFSIPLRELIPVRMEEPTTITEESDDQSSVKSDDSCGSSSNRVKFLCSYGGRILPRPGDGKLRYAGGDTRVVAASRSISFADLIAKMSKVFESAVLLKCQLPSEDLDALVSVKSDEDLENTLEEYDRVGAREGLSKVRAFLFPHSISASKPPAAGHMDDRSERSSAEAVIVKPQDEGQVVVSNPNHQISQWQEPQRTDLHRVQYYPSHCSPLAQKHPTDQVSTRGSRPNQQHVVATSAKTRRPPRWTAVHSEAQYSSPVRYAILRSATQIQLMKPPPPSPSPPQRKFARGAGDSQFVCIDHSSSPRVVHINNAPQVQLRFPGKTAIKAEESVTTAYKYILRSPYHQSAPLHAQEQFLVQH